MGIRWRGRHLQGAALPRRYTSVLCWAPPGSPTCWPVSLTVFSCCLFFLAELADVEGPAAAPLAPETVHALPMLALEGVVLFPGDVLPLRLLRAQDRALADRALQAPPPLTGLVAVVSNKLPDVLPGVLPTPSGVAELSCRHHAWLQVSSQSLPAPISSARLCAVGCSAQIFKVSEDGTAVLALGRQRVVLLPESLHGEGLTAARFKVLADIPPTSPPREVAALMTRWAPWAYNAQDSDRLARRAKASFAKMAPLVRLGAPRII